ncbi:MAG: plastocyanin [Oscillatoria sp. SIO1A7]|nr:plastocyanin [Oscillatoria sp. SIO1A7]
MDFLVSLSRRFAVVLSVSLLAIASLAFFPSPANAATQQVKMGGDNFMLIFQPKTLAVAVGDTVTFINNKAAPHNVVFEDHPELSHKGMFFRPGESYDVTFDASGTYNFYCEPHRGAGMFGKITVE